MTLRTRDPVYKNFFPWTTNAAPGVQHGSTTSRFIALKREKDSWRDGSTLPQPTTRQTYKRDVAMPVNAPAWDVMEQKVLRFYGYFKEHVDESREGNHRIRPCEILYFLEDDTMQIIEPKSDNSGMVHGTLIKRHRFANSAEPERLVSPADLRIGGSFPIYGKIFAITTCDDFTKEWYSSVGLSQPPDQNRERPARKDGSDPGDLVSNNLKNCEGNTVGARRGIPFSHFLEKSEPVCRFFAIVDDCSTNMLERRTFSLLYFPSDDTVEIRENIPLQDGCGRFSVFLRRKRLLKGNGASVGPADPLPKESNFFHLSDFQVGSVIVVADREFFIYAADAFTKSFVKDELGIELRDPISVDAHPIQWSKNPSREEPAKKAAYNSRPVTGSSEDCQLTIHCSDGEENVEPVLYTAIVDGNACSCADNRIVNIRYYPDDKSLSVFDPSVRKSEISGGQLIQRAVYFNEILGRPFEIKDFVVGSTITIDKQDFRITNSHEATGGPCQQRNQESNRERVLVLLKSLWEALHRNDIKTNGMFVRCDEQRNSLLTYQDFRREMERFGHPITEQEALAIARYFDLNGDGKVDYEEFCNGISELHTPFVGKSKRLNGILSENLDQYRETAKVEQRKLEEEKAVNRSFKQMQARFYQQPQLLQLLAKEFARAARGRTVTLDEAVRVFDCCGCNQTHEGIKSTVEALLPGAGLHEIDYIKLISALKSTCRGV